MQVSERPSGEQGVEGFRRDLRILEREVVRQLEGQTTCCGVTLPQCHVLLELSCGELSLTDLSTALDLDKSTLSRTVEGMVQAGLVERSVDPGDRRAVRLRLARVGREHVRTIDRTCNDYYEGLLGPLGDRARRQVLGAVRLLAEGMRRLRTGPPGAPSCCATPRPRAETARPRPAPGASGKRGRGRKA